MLRSDDFVSLEKRLPLGDEAYDTVAKTLSPLREYAKNLVGSNDVAERLRNTTLASYTFLAEQFSLLQNGQRKPRLAVATPSTPRTDSGVDSSMLGSDNGPAVIAAGVQLHSEDQNMDALVQAHHGVNDPQRRGFAAYAGEEIATTNQNQWVDPESKSSLQYSTPFNSIDSCSPSLPAAV